MKDDEIDKIVDYFTEKLYSHQYLIGRKEARDDLNLKNIIFANKELSESMTQLYEEYKKEMDLGKQWIPENELGLNSVQNTKGYKIAYIESEDKASYFGISIEYKKQQVNVMQQTPQGPIQIPQEQVGWRITDQGWK
jgi:hypothetical protein